MQRILLSLALAAILGGCMSAQRLAEKEKAPAWILDVPSEAALHVWREALADGGNRFDERTLVALAGRLFQDVRDDYDHCKEHVIDSLLSRPEFTEMGLRAVEPLLLTGDAEIYGCYESIAVYVNHPCVPADILSAYADQPWNRLDKKGRRSLEPPVVGVQHFAARRLLQRQREGASIADAPTSPFVKFILRLMETPVAIPEELEVDSPLAGWMIEENDYVFVHTLEKGSSRLADAPCDLVGGRLLFEEPFRPAADWRSKVQASGLILAFPSAEKRNAFLREVVPAYAMTGELPENGYPMRPDVRALVGYIVTEEEIGGQAALRFTRRWPRR